MAGARYLKPSEPQQVVRESKPVQQELGFLWKVPAPESRRALRLNLEMTRCFLAVGLVQGAEWARPWG